MSCYLPFEAASEDAAIIQGRRDGERWAMIASRLDRSPNSISLRFYHHLLNKTLREELQQYREFTSAEDQVILRGREEGSTLRDIARRLGRSLSSVEKRYGRSLRPGSQTGDPADAAWKTPYTAAQIRELLRLREEEGVSFNEIARRMGRNARSLARLYFAHRPYRNPNQWYTTAKDERLFELRQSEGSTWASIARQMSPRTMRSVLHRYHRILENFSNVGSNKGEKFQ